MWINQALKAITDEHVINQAKNIAQRSLDGVQEAGRTTYNTWKNILAKEPDALYKTADDLVDESNLLEREAIEQKNFYNEYIHGLGLDDELSQAIGRAYHKTGISARLLEDILSGRASAKKLDIDDVLSALNRATPEQDDIFDGVNKMTDYMIDPASVDESLTFGYRNADALYDRFMSDIGQGKPSTNLAMNDAKAYDRMITHRDTFFDEYQDYLRLKAWEKFDAKDKELILRSLRGKQADDIKRIFGYRDKIDESSKILSDVHTKKNLLPNYTFKSYDDVIQDVIVPKTVADEMVSYGAGKIMKEFKLDGKTLVRVKPKIDYSQQRVQGALKLSGMHKRGSSVDLSGHDISFNSDTLTELGKDRYRVSTLVHRETGEEIPFAEAFMSGKYRADELKIGTVEKAFSDAEQLAKGRKDYAHDVIANTFGKLYKDRASGIMRLRAEEETLMVKSSDGIADDLADDNLPLFIGAGKKRFDPISQTYLDNKTDDVLAWETRNKDALEKHYVNLEDEGINMPIDADWIHKDYYRELLGYQHWRLTDGLGWKSQMLEALHVQFIDFVRSNISIKNPAVLLNNTVAGIGMQLTDNIPIKLATENTLEAFKALKRMHYLKSEKFRLEQEYRGIENAVGTHQLPHFNAVDSFPEDVITQYDAIVHELGSNIAYQAEKSGILKSFLDEGLWDRYIRENADESFDKAFAKNLLLTEDSKWGINVRKWHDYSDMMNRVAVFKYLTQQADEAELLKKGINSHGDIDGVRRRIDEMFVNYSKLLPPFIASMRRGGGIPFAQWFFKAPPFMIRQIREHPVRALTVFAGYEAVQTLMSDDGELDVLHGDFKDAYIGDMHTDSKYSQNALRPANWLDAVNPVGFDTDAWIPSYIAKVQKGLPDALGITMKEY